MEITIINDISELKEKIKGTGWYIYGSQITAVRTCQYLKNTDCKIDGFVDSEVSPDQQLSGIPLCKADDMDINGRKFIIAVSAGHSWEISDYLDEKGAGQCMIISPFCVKSFPVMVSPQSMISERAWIHPNAQIYADENSCIELEPDCVINENTEISATNGGYIHIGKSTVIDSGSQIIMERPSSKIYIADNNNIGRQVHFHGLSNSEINVGSSCDIEESGTIRASNGKITLGKNVGIARRVYIAAVKSNVTIGADTKISYDACIITGGHHLYADNREITNFKEVIIGNHVWIGARPMLFPGCDIGDGCIVGAGTFVNHHVDKCSLCVGSKGETTRTNVSWKV